MCHLSQAAANATHLIKTQVYFNKIEFCTGKYSVIQFRKYLRAAQNLSAGHMRPRAMA